MRKILMFLKAGITARQDARVFQVGEWNRLVGWHTLEPMRRASMRYMHDPSEHNTSQYVPHAERPAFQPRLHLAIAVFSIPISSSIHQPLYSPLSTLHSLASTFHASTHSRGYQSTAVVSAGAPCDGHQHLNFPSSLAKTSTPLTQVSATILTCSTPLISSNVAWT